MEHLESRLSEIRIEAQSKTVDNKWGLPLRDLYRHSLNFYKDKSGKAVHLSYEDNLKLVAFTQQTAHGAVTDAAAPIGAFDVIGRDRRIAWQNLGTISKTQAMEGFIDLLDRLCPLFRPYIEAIKKDQEEKQRLATEAERRQREQLELEKQLENEQRQIEEQRNREEMQKRKLQDALNQQTYLQFRAYAEKQYPGNPEQQATLIRQLQNEHYHQYMQQLHAQMSGEKNDRPSGKGENEDVENGQCNGIGSNASTVGEQTPITAKETAFEEKEQDSDCDSDGFAVISPPDMWTKPNILEFKAEVANGKGEGVIKVGHGDIVTVRVPTHEGGSSLFWEFATDSYDIGFGIYFEWGKPVTNEVQVQICESDDDDDEEGDGDDETEIHGVTDLESGAPTNSGQLTPPVRFRSPLSTVVPVYRRECQLDVYVGTHKYPGEGTYLLKFDNSYSLWRSKQLYYRVYYTR